MGVYIKGMKMPKNCACCRLWDTCILLNELSIEDYETLLDIVDYEGYVKANGCPLIEVEEPHGRLIDAEYLKEHLYQCDINGMPLHIMELDDRLACISDVPTVIEAEGE